MCKHMKNITLSLPETLLSKMKQHEEIRWSALIRRMIGRKITELELMDKIAARSALTEKDAEEISKLINQSATKKLGI